MLRNLIDERAEHARHPRHAILPSWFISTAKGMP